jgi:hypothetical protein
MPYDFYRSCPPEQTEFDAVAFARLHSRRKDTDHFIIRAAVSNNTIDISGCLVPDRQVTRLHNVGIGMSSDPYIAPLTIRYNERQVAFRGINPYIVAATFFLLRDQCIGVSYEFPNPDDIGHGLFKFTQHSSPFWPILPPGEYHAPSLGMPGVLVGAAALRTAWYVSSGYTITDFSVNERQFDPPLL